MTSYRIHREHVIECNGHCDKTIEGATFEECWNDAKADGWTAKMMGMDRNGRSKIWNHYCPDCRGAAEPKADLNRITKGLL